MKHYEIKHYETDRYGEGLFQRTERGIIQHWGTCQFQLWGLNEAQAARKVRRVLGSCRGLEIDDRGQYSWTAKETKDW